MGLTQPGDAGACSRRNRPGARALVGLAEGRLARGLDRRTTREGRARARTRGGFARSSEVLGFLRLRERVTQLRPRAVQAGFDRRDRKAEGLADLFQREVRVVVEKDGQAI